MNIELPAGFIPLASFMSTSSINKPGYFYLFSLLLVLLVYGRSIFFEYVWDDNALLVFNPAMLNEGLNWELIARPVLQQTSYFRPLVFLSWWLEVQVFGRLSSTISHAVNVAAFYLLGLVIFSFMRRLLTLKFQTPWATPLAAFATAVYLLHPANVEVAAWVAGRFDLLATLFIFLALRLQLGGPARGWRLLAIGLCALLALGAKETGLLLLGFSLLLDLYQRQDGQRPWGELLRESGRQNRALYGLLLLLALAYLLLRSFYASGLYHHGLSWDYIKTAYFQQQLPLLALKEYVLYSALPFFHQGVFSSLDYFLEDRGGYGLSWVVGALFFGALAWLLWRRRAGAALLLAYLLGLLLVLHLVGINLAGNLIQHRFLLLPLPFFCLGLALLGQRFLARQPEPSALAQDRRLLLPLAYLLALLITASIEASHWKNSDVLWRANEANYRKYNYGLSSVNYFQSLLKSRDNRAEVERIVGAELDITARYHFAPRPEIYIGYAEYLIHRFKDPRGLAMLGEQIKLFENKDFWFKGEVVKRNQLLNLYVLQVRGHNYIDQDHQAARAALDKVRALVGEKFDDNMEYLQEDLLLALLEDRPEQVKHDLAQLAKFQRVQYSDKPAAALLANYVHYFVRASCQSHPRPSPACAPDFDLHAYGRQLSKD